ncbi:MAG: NAD(P)-dependent oxidoreductase [Nitrososphaerota archaeon]|nr:NAD(P)-dependent oxidoreductase [Nitrososphaerota archaeon]MDG6937279.1 NAD(P)-dependent oxidoreductase [Nitrososphaerota archaeon]MDG6961361.1 NAD(P)-dependent oxidoreductase [Nitrososphaerota archaeon]MDG6962821.1 NAD(P)-dependent oxidoreductase [Nitrososphaerota archaeon]MDG6984868.1 NAD(P)-dependent oxidoreductase [Nitrososphaerota archaeon]
MNLLVGGTGFVGGHLVEYLFQQGEISKGAFRKGAHLKTMDTNGVQGVEVDLADHHSLHEAMESVDAVYNLASPMPYSGSGFMGPNTEGILNLLEAATEAKAKCFVHLSTLDVYGFGAGKVDQSRQLRPAGEYQTAKAEAERLLLEFTKRTSSPRVTIIRAAKAFGSRDQSIAVPLLKMVEQGRVVVPRGSSMSYTHPRDIAQAMYRAATGTLATGTSFLVKSFDATPEALARGVSSAIGKTPEFKKQGLFSGPAVSKYASDQLSASLAIDDQPDWSELGYAPQFGLKATCDEVAAWYRKEPWVTEGA